MSVQQDIQFQWLIVLLSPEANAVMTGDGYRYGFTTLTDTAYRWGTLMVFLEVLYVIFFISKEKQTN